MREPASAAGGPRPLWRRFLLFLGPLVLTNVLQALAGTLNNIYLGQLLGTPAMAAATSLFPLLMACIAFVIGLGAGASILVGQAWGARDLEQVRRIAGTVLVGGLTLAACVGALGIVGIAPVLRALGTPAEILPDAIGYARVTFLGLPALFLSMLASAILRGTGDTVTPLRTLLATCVVSMTLTPLLIRGWLGLPPLGVASAAWANLCANCAGVAWLAWHLARRQHVAAFGALRGHFRFERALLRTVVRLGIPTGLFFITSSLADVLLLSLVNRHGAQATAAWGAVNQVMAYVQFPAMSIAIAASVFAAQAIGAGDHAEIAQVTRVGVWLNVWLTGGLAVLVALLAPSAAALFLREPQVVAFTASLLHVTVWGSICFGIASVFTAVMRAAGTVRVPTMISLGCIIVLVPPFAFGFQQLFGVRGIWVSYPATYACALVLQSLYFFGVWRRRPIARLV